ncbi:MAG: hypothetical protein H6739_06245 [Alphaproteobacteria bacterium]|nr:hypothetical protein [Alphaproteobacteria bacterium]
MDPFCNPFDAALAAAGPPAVFTRTADGEWRIAPDLSRDCWERTGPEPALLDPAHALVRDRATGFVSWWFVTARKLLADHPRVDVVLFDTGAQARAALEALGRPPVVSPDGFAAAAPPAR